MRVAALYGIHGNCQLWRCSKNAGSTSITCSSAATWFPAMVRETLARLQAIDIPVGYIREIVRWLSPKPWLTR